MFGQVVLHWTATGDDGNVGQAAGYDIRYRAASLGPIDSEQDWETATQVFGEPAPCPSGYADSMLVVGLLNGASYYFCMKACDEAYNYSDLSNSPLITVVDSCFYLATDTDGCGTIELDPPYGCYDEGDTVVITAQPCPYWEFTGWSGDMIGDGNPAVIVIYSDLEITANFWTDFVPGDANGDGVVNSSDVTYLVRYLRDSGPPPAPLLAGDANGDCQVLSSDVMYLVSYMRGTGDAPVRGDCIGL